MPLVIYTLLRLALFGAAFGVLYLVGMRGWLLPVVAVVIALTVSYLALSRPRDAAARWMAERAERRAAARATGQHDVDALHEDARLDEELRSDP
ncbi:DUF4229 domain-containing protein [Promicromonospora citrea]|uniref:DUF4229 domain-containing protein n=1 Tax=Promicromonospora citrea TaxID=43677 RepID=UPI00148880BB|nr:DUF4229 domain-containing protein [Promicromonospora citrea]NNH51849.1 DUF4229 domain-containing protein [Promicromonospora citrea]